MPVPAHLRLTVRGHFGTVGSVIETWACNLNFVDQSFPNAAARQTAVESAYSNLGGLMTMYNSNVTLDGCRIAEVDGTGHVSRNSDGSYRQADSTAAAVGGSQASTVLWPTTSALVVTLTSARPGSTGKGRVFLPLPHYALVAGTYELSSTDATTVATKFKTSLNALTQVLSSPLICSSKGYVSNVTGIKVGRRPDTQRSRGGAMLENYVSLAL